MKKLILVITLLISTIGFSQISVVDQIDYDKKYTLAEQDALSLTLGINDRREIWVVDTGINEKRAWNGTTWVSVEGSSGPSTDDLDDVVQRGNGTTLPIITRGLTIQQNDLILDSFTGMYELTLVNPSGHSANHTQSFSDGSGLLEVYSGKYDASTNTPSLSNLALHPGVYYLVSTAGTQDFGNGNITFAVGDYVGCDDIQWFKKVDNNQDATIPYNLTLGVSDDTSGSLIVTGDNAGTSGSITVDNPASYDTNLDSYIFRTLNGNLILLANGGVNGSSTPLLTFNSSTLQTGFGNYEFPRQDGTAGQVLTTDGSGQVTFQDVSSSVNSITWQTEISTNTTFSGTQKGLNTIYPFNSTSSIVATIDKGTYAVGDVINFNRRGSGSVEILSGTDVRLNGVRNQDNRFFINNIGSNAFIQFSHLDGSTLVGNVIGNITGGYEGAVIATNYSELREGDTGVNLTITGSGLSNATVSFSTGVTLNSIVSTSNNEMVVNVDVTALETETVTPTFDNGDITIDTDAITIAAAPPALPSYADYVAWYKFENTTPSDETGNHNGTNNGATVITGQVNNGYAFDGVDDYVSGLTDLGITDIPCTFDFWVRVSDVSGLKWFVTNNDQFNYKGIFPYISDAKFGIQFGDGAGTGSTDRKNFVSTNDVITTNTWHHISVIITDINTITLKVDNVTQAIPFSSGTASSVSFTGIDYQFGRKVFNSTLYYSVDLDELKVYDRALTSTEQTDIHTLESAGNPMISN